LIKPGENTNRGNGIELVDSVEAAREAITNKLNHQHKHRTFILQEYIMPFLYERRKFDIRCYMLVTSMNHMVKGYWYEEGYIRTSSKNFSRDNITSRMIHLTNDAVQKKGEDYGRFEPANKLSFADFEKYLNELSKDGGNI
jgi:tubulin--tyrosine ligase